MRRLKVTIAVLAVTLMTAAPAMADTASAGAFTAQSEFFGGDFATTGGATAETVFFGGDFAEAGGATAESQFFGGTVFGDDGVFD